MPSGHIDDATYSFDAYGLNASIDTSGVNALVFRAQGGGYPGMGGVNGSGGTIGVNSLPITGAGGGGFYGNGGTHYGTGHDHNTMYAQGGFSYLNGGEGGLNGPTAAQAGPIPNGNGGFGGGGGAGQVGAGGGGGYSGGGAGWYYVDSTPIPDPNDNGNSYSVTNYYYGGGGGGGSYLDGSASNPLKSVGNKGNGAVNIYITGTPCTWIGGAGNGSWTAFPNWNYQPLPGYVVNFSGSNQTAVDTVANQSVGGIIFNAGAAAFTISNNTITLAGNVTNQSTSNQTINSGIALASDASLVAESGNLFFGGPIRFGDNFTLLTISGTNPTYISGSITGNGSLVKNGTGNLTLAETNTYTGNTTINEGNLIAAVPNALPDSGVLTLNSNSTFTIAWGQSIGSLQGVGTIVIAQNEWLAVNQFGNTTYSGAIIGDGFLSKNGNGTLTLSGNSTYSENTYLNAGTLVLAGINAAGSGSIIQESQQMGPPTLLQIDTTGTITNNMTVQNLLATQNATLTGGIHLDYDTVMNVQSGATLTISGSLAWTNTLTKNGNGTLVLYGNSTYYGVGGITVNAGTLTGSTTSLQGPIQNNGTVEFYQNTNGTISSSISGTGSVIKRGSGTLTLHEGTYNYSGATTVASGTLASGDLPNSTLILQPGAAYSPGGFINTTNVGGMTLNGGDMLYNLGESSVTVYVDGSGTAALNGPVIFEFSQNGYVSGNYTLLTGNGVQNFNLGNLHYNAVGNFSLSGGFVVRGDSLLFETAPPHVNYTWTGGAGNGSWNAAANWASNQLPNGVIAYFAGNNQTSVDTDTNQSVGGIVFNAGASPFTISNNTITLAGNIENDSTNTQTINSALLLESNALFAADSGNLAFGGAISFGTNSTFLTISGANPTSITGNISGGGSLLMRGTGNLTLSGINTYTGNTSINGGNLIVQGGAALPDTGTVTLNSANATFTIGTSETIGSLQGGGTTSINTGQTLTIAQTGNTTYGGSITGAGALTKNGSGALTLSGTNSYLGNTTINSGNLLLQGGYALLDTGIVTLNSANATFTIGTSETIGSLQGVGITAINDGETLTIAQTGNTTYSGPIVGAGALGLTVNGTLTLSGNSTFSGGTILQTGTLVLAGVNAAGSGRIEQNALAGSSFLQIGTTGTITNNMTVLNLLATQNATLTGGIFLSDAAVMNVQSGATLTLAGSLTGDDPVSLTKTGSGTLVLNGNNPFSGPININAGTLAGSTTSLQGPIQNNGAVEFYQNTNGTISSPISGTGSVTKSGSGTLTLGGGLTYSGATTVASGTLASESLPNSTLILQSGAAYSPGGLNTIDIINVGGITLNGGDLLYNLGNATSDLINSAGTAALNGPVVFDFSNLGFSAGTFTLLTGNGVSTFNTANLGYNAVGNFSVSGNFVVSGNSLLFQTAAVDNYTWTGGAGNGNWNVAANWATDQIPPDWKTIHFAGNNELDVNIDTDQSVLGIVFDANAESFTIYTNSNNSINLAGNIECDSPNDQTINCHINLVSNTVIAADAGRLALGGLITFGENSKFLAISGANATSISGNISGNGSLLKRGTGNLTLSGTNTYAGNTLINGGNLILEGGAALKDTGIVKLAASGATLTIGTSETIGSLQGGGTTAIHTGQTLTIAETGNATYGGSITGAGALTKTGTGTLRLTGSSNHAGGTTLSGGTLQVLHPNALGDGALYLSSGTLAVGDSSNSGGNGGSGGLLVGGHIEWVSSNAIVSLPSTGNITTAGNFTHGGNPGNRTFDFGSGQHLQLGNNTLVSFGATTFNATHFLATASPGTSLSGNFQIVGNSLVYVLQGGSASGSVINNSGAGGTQTWMDFTVSGSLTTAIGNNTIRSLTFTNNGNLAIQAGYALTLSQGQVAVENGSSVVSGGTLATPGNFNKTGAGELDVQSTLLVNGTASIDAGLLSVNGNLIANSVAVGSGNGGDAALQVNGQLTANTVVVGNPGHSAGGGFATNTLTVNGQLAANSLVVNQGGALGGSGTIFAPVTVSGTLAPGNSPGTLSMASLALTPTAVTDIEIASPTNYDRIVVSGSANLGGALNVIPYNGNPLAYGQQAAFLTAAGGISGEFDTINAPATFRGRFLKLGTITALQAIYVPADDLTGVILIAPDTYTRVAVTPNQRNVAKALDSFIPATSGDQQTVSIALDLQTAEQYPTAFEQIMPGFYESLANMAIEQAFNQTQMLNQRISSVRLGASGFQAIGGITQPLLHDKNGKSAAEAKDASPIVESATATNWNAWALGTGMFSRTTNLGSLQNYNNDAGGFLVGSDYRWSENFVTGLYAGYDYSYAEYNGGGSTKGNSFSFGTYASYEKDGYYADAVIGGGYTGFQTQRSIAFGTIDRTASADPNSGQFTAGLNLGKDFEVGKFTLGPIVGAQYTYAGIGSFTESGAESLDLSLGQQNANSLRSTLGGRVAYTWNLNQKIALIPEVRMFWQHEFLNNARNISASLDGGTGAAFDFETTDPYRNSVFAGAGVTAQFGKNLSGSVFYNINFGSQTYQNNMVSAGLNISF